MLLTIILCLLLNYIQEYQYILINDVLYKLPVTEITKIKTINNIQDKDIKTFKFNESDCFAKEIEWIKVKSIKIETDLQYKNFIVKSPAIFICEGDIINFDEINKADIQSIEPLPKDVSVERFGCKGLSPVFNLVMRKQISPNVKPMTSSAQEGHFKIIGETKGFKDSSILYLNKLSGSFKDNIDSAYVIHNTFTFNGSVIEPQRFIIHTGYTGWDYPFPEDFRQMILYVSNTSIYLEDTVGDLKFATLSGSELQNDWSDLREKLKRYLIIGDSINRLPRSSPRRLVLQMEMQKQIEASILIFQNFIKTHPKSFISIDILNRNKVLWGIEKTKELFGPLYPQIKNTTPGKFVQEYININTTPINKAFIDLELSNLNGELVKLSSLKGKYILLDFWASWCGPCRAEHPQLLKLYNQFKEKGFEIYAVSLDTKKDVWQKTVKDDKITWITVSDLKGSANSKAAMLYEVTAIPRNFLIDREGRIIAEDLRGEDLAIKLNEIF
ncbi:MAG: TlpA disulfide reductase family protein [Bacteroidales bacterium]|jgi:peroxiredoxin|nr:TlpA disulfide reductase family protein [Bacteroidales bacterium]